MLLTINSYQNTPCVCMCSNAAIWRTSSNTWAGSGGELSVHSSTWSQDWSRSSTWPSTWTCVVLLLQSIEIICNNCLIRMKKNFLVRFNSQTRSRFIYSLYNARIIKQVWNVSWFLVESVHLFCRSAHVRTVTQTWWSCSVVERGAGARPTFTQRTWMFWRSTGPGERKRSHRGRVASRPT